jgi:SAM-dependent methyltransferase
MRDKIKTLVKCRVCGAKDFYDFLDLGTIPIPNGFLSKEDLTKKEEKYPLVVTICANCHLVQLRHNVNPKIMFSNYLYIPSASKTRINNFRELSKAVKKKILLDDKSLVVDIGSNDGSLLNYFKNFGVQVLGVDPAKNLVTVAKLNGIPTVHSFFMQTIAKRIVKKHKKASVMLATNVVAHVNNLHDFFKAINILLSDDGVFVCQFPYLLDLIEKNQFDTIYHEHLSYFSLKPLMKLASIHDLDIFDIEKMDLDGGSVRVYWKKKKNKKWSINQKRINKLLHEENNAGLYDKKTYDKFAKRIKKLKSEVKKELLILKKRNSKIVGYGAAAKGNILLNYFEVGSDILDYIVDSTPYKQGLYTPGTHIPIFEENKIETTKPEYLLLLAWNFKDEIIQKSELHKKRGGRFIVTVPSLQII